jgi:hypothetical protein
MKANRLYWVVLLCAVATAARPASVGDKLNKDDKTLVVNLTSPISTKDSKAGDTFTAQVLEPADLQGAVVEGAIKKVEPAQNMEAPKSHIIFGFQTLTLSDNTTFDIKADLKEIVNSKGVAKVDEEGQVISTGNGLKRGLFGAGGAGLGSLAGGMIGGGVGSMVGGMAAGGAAGYLISLDFTASSHNIEFYPGTHFTLQLSESRMDKKADGAAIHQQEATNEAAMASQAAAPAPATIQAATPAPALPATPQQ